MTRFHRLEDVLTPWRDDCAPHIAAAAERIAGDTAAAALPDEVAPDHTGAGGPLRAVRDEAVGFAVTELLPRCLRWLAAEGLGPPDELQRRVFAEAAAAVRRAVPAYGPLLPPPLARTPRGALAVAAAVGAALGCLALGPLSLLVLGRREPGLAVGGAAGAAALIALVTWLGQRPVILQAVERVVGAAGLLAALGGAVRAVRLRSSGLVRTTAWAAGSWVVLVLARPRLVRPTRAQCAEALRPQVEALLRHASDLVLALCWSHPDRTGGPAEPMAEALLPAAVADALGVLQVVSADPAASDRHLRLAVQAVLQRVHEEGYAWQSVPAGTPYDGALGVHFECFGRVEPGQAVETLAPARTRHGALEQRGLVRPLG